MCRGPADVFLHVISLRAESVLIPSYAQVTKGLVNGVSNVVSKMRATMGFAKKPNIFMMHQMER